MHLRAPLTYLGDSAELYISHTKRTKKKIGQCQLFTKKTISSILKSEIMCFDSNEI